MLNKRIADLNEVVWQAAAIVGLNPAKIADHIIKELFPRTFVEAEIEGADRMLRTGLIDAIKPMLRGGIVAKEQGDFGDLNPTFRALADDLKSAAYFVEALGEQVPVARLVANPDLLDDARKFMRRKGDECIAEAVRLDLLYEAVVAEQSA